MGDIHARQGHHDQAEAQYRQALRLNRDSARLHACLARALADQGRLEEAATAYRQAVHLNPQSAEGYFNLGTALTCLGRTTEALACFDTALGLDPDSAQTHVQRAMLCLLRGDFAAGWAEYEWRWLCPEFKPLPLKQPVWDGSPLAGRTLLLHTEQGLGDAIQFIRFAALAPERGGRVLVACPPSLVPLLSTCPGIDGCVPNRPPLPEHDLARALLSLPALFRTTLDTIPTHVPYLFADAARCAHWRQELRRLQGIKIGIAWQGNPGYNLDRYRSVPLRHFAPLARLRGVHLISLQKGPGTEQMADLAGPLGITDLGSALDAAGGAFTDTAAIMKNLDLVITSDTAVAHLAGALGVPVWVALPFAPEWRWLLERQDSPWYPTMRLFRQTAPGDWDAVFQHMADELVRQRRLDASAPSQPAAALHERAVVRADPDINAGPATCPRAVESDPIAVGMAGMETVTRPCRHGLMAFQPHDRYIGQSLDRYGEYSEAEVRVFQKLVRPGDVVLDVGANIGAHTVPLARLAGPNGQVLAFEPQRTAFYCLCANVVLNDLAYVHCHREALGDAEGTVHVPDLDYRVSQNFGGLALGTSTPARCTEAVPIRRIDELRLERCRLIKVDVEGMERQVIAGARETIRTLRPLLYVEDDRADYSRELRALLQSLGYRLYRHLPPLFNANNFRGDLENVFGNTVSANLYCVPLEHESPVDPLEFAMHPAT